MEGRTMKKHVVIVPFSMHGHLIPALMLAQRLDAIGFEVTYVCPENRIHHVRNHARARGCNEGGINFVILKERPHLVNNSEQSSHDTFDVTLSLIDESRGSQDLKNDLRKFFQDLKTSTSPPCCIIGDNLFSWVQDIADELKLPRLVMYPSPAQALAVIFHLKHMLETGRYPINTGGADINIPGINSALHPKDFSTPSLDTSPKMLQDFYIRNALRMHEAAGIICNTFEFLEPEACSSMATNRELNPRLVPFLPAGPLLPHQYLTDSQTELPSTEHDEQVQLWLNKQPQGSVLFISFGSISKTSREQVREVAAGVEASGRRFLWVIPSNEETFFQDELVAKVQDRGLVIHGWVNQLLVLCHSATGGFLSHAGWNSTLESISQGVPMVMLPLFAEQRGNARMVRDRLKVGIWLTENESFAREDVEKAVREVMQEQGCYREMAIKFMNAARQAAKLADEKMVNFITRCISMSSGD